MGDIAIESEAASLGIWSAFGLMLVSFAILAKCADWFVEGALEIARRLNAPPILIGIVIVSIGTTAPELAVSVQAALAGRAEYALGNAVGSVIYDDGIALPLAALLAPAAIVIDKRVLRSSAVFLIAIDILAYSLCFDGTLGRGEGLILVLGFVGYLYYLYRDQKRRRGEVEVPLEAGGKGRVRILLFFLGLAGVLISSEWIVDSAPVVARHFGVPDVVIALTLIALGTSVPEIATCIVSARKGQGALAAGNILGADILNICWIAGASAVVNPLTVGAPVIHFMFPSMLVIVLTMLALMRMGWNLNKWKGLVLLGLCTVYLVLLFVYNPGALPAG